MSVLGAGGMPTCHACAGKMVEYPPPVPSPFACMLLLFHTTQDHGLTSSSVEVPPQPMMCGQDAGQSTFAGVGPPSDESLSPEAANTSMSWPACLRAKVTAAAMSCAQTMKMSAGWPVAML